MKILVICQYYYPEPFRITDACEEFVKRGNDVTVLTGLPNYPEGKILKEYTKKAHRDEVRNGVRIIRCYEHGRGDNKINLAWNYFSYALSASKKIADLDGDFDVVFINQLSPVMMAWPGLKYAKKYKKRTVLYCYDLWPASLDAGGIKQGSIVYKLFSKISKKVYNRVDHICVASKSFMEYFETEHGINRSKISYLPQYCEDLFKDIPPITSKKDTIDFVFAGNIGAMQSVETIIQAANLVKDNEKIKIHIVGDGRDLDNCKKLAERLKTDNVIFYGRRPLEEMPHFYSLADAMLITLAKSEFVSKTLPGKVQSYMVVGKPIIGAIDGETKRIVEEAKCGIVCDAEDYVSLARLFTTFEAGSYSSHAIEYSNQQFSKERFFDQLLSRLQSNSK